MTDDRSARADFPEFYSSRELRSRVPTMSNEDAIPTSAILTGEELTLDFDRPEFDPTPTTEDVRDAWVTAWADRTLGATTGDLRAEFDRWLAARDSETLIARLEAWARDRDYDFTRVTRPEYVEGFRDAQGVVLGLIQAWDEPEPQDGEGDA